jgi:hypothetical protein
VRRQRAVRAARRATLDSRVARLGSMPVPIPEFKEARPAVNDITPG